jgi:hypothetical protein
VTQQLPPNFLVYKTYGNFRALRRTGQTFLHADSYTRGLVEFFFFFFFFFTSTFERENFLNSRQKDFETLGWLEETSVI